MENSLHEYISENPFQPGDLLIRIKGWEDDIGCLFMAVSAAGPTALKISPSKYDDFSVYHYIDYTEFKKVGNIKDALRQLANAQVQNIMLEQAYQKFSIKGVNHESDQRKSKS